MKQFFLSRRDAMHSRDAMHCVSTLAIFAAIVVSAAFVFSSCDFFDLPEKDDDDDNNEIVIEETDEQRMAIIKQKFKEIQTWTPATMPEITSEDLFLTVPSSVSPYRTGVVKPEVLKGGLNTINLMRYIAGLPDDIELDANFTDLCQHGAVVVSAIKQLTHYPTKPAGMSDEFFQKGAHAARVSNISSTNLPYYAIRGQMLDTGFEENIRGVGHRRWLLHPMFKKTGIGISADTGTGTRYCLVYVTGGGGDAAYDYIAWPSPGAFPAELMRVDIPWSISVNLSKYGTPSPEKVKVELKHIQTGKTFNFSKDAPNSDDIFENFFTIVANNCIIFRPEQFLIVGRLYHAFDYDPGDVFQVKVTGLNEDIVYQVKLFKALE